MDNVTLMAREYLYDEGFETYQVVNHDVVTGYPDEYFTVPTPIAEAYVAALKAVSNLEAVLDTYCEENGHRKHWPRKYMIGWDTIT